MAAHTPPEHIKKCSLSIGSFLPCNKAFSGEGTIHNLQRAITTLEMFVAIGNGDGLALTALHHLCAPSTGARMSPALNRLYRLASGAISWWLLGKNRCSCGSSAGGSNFRLLGDFLTRCFCVLRFHGLVDALQRPDNSLLSAAAHGCRFGNSLLSAAAHGCRFFFFF